MRVAGRFAYLTIILDASSLKVVGYAWARCSMPDCSWRPWMRPLRRASHLLREVFQRPIETAQYASRRYREALVAVGISGSMSRMVNPYDNAHAESLRKTYKQEEALVTHGRSIQDLIDRLPAYIEQTYNADRLHSALGYLPPD